jgi:hypothetical protein
LGEEYDLLGEMTEPPERNCEEPEGEEYRHVVLHRKAEIEYRDVDTIGSWREAVKRMRTCVALWDKIRKGELAGKERDAAAQRVQLDINFMIGEGQLIVSFERAKRRNLDMIHLIPRHLLGALWLQFALAVGGEKEYRACPSCRGWFELSPETAKKSKMYCKEACRSRAYRDRKCRAQELAAEGKRPAEVAKELGTDVKTVKKWLDEKGK